MMEAYIYQAAVYCEECGKAIRDDITARGEAPANPDEFPQGPFADGGGESDVPEHCASCHKFLQNPLTGVGYKYVAEKCHEDSDSETVQEWFEYYSPEIIDYLKVETGIDWDGVRAELDGEEWEQGDDRWTEERRIYLGSVFSWTPSGKYYMPWACSNVNDLEATLDELWWEAVEAEADEHDLFVTSGEGDPCDIIIGESRDVDRDEV